MNEYINSNQSGSKVGRKSGPKYQIANKNNGTKELVRIELKKNDALLPILLLNAK